MILLNEEFEYKGFKLGQMVRFKKNSAIHKIIGFNLNSIHYYIAINKDVYKDLSKSSYNKTIVTMEGYENFYNYVWVKPSEIEIINKDNKDIKVGEGLIITPNPIINIGIISNDCKKEGYNKCLQMVEQLEKFKDKNRFVVTINDDEWFVEIVENKHSVYHIEDKFIKSNRQNLHEVIKNILYNNE